MSHDILYEFMIFMHSHGQQTSLKEEFRFAKLPFPRQLSEKRKNLQYKPFGRGWVRKMMVMTSVYNCKLCVHVLHLLCAFKRVCVHIHVCVCVYVCVRVCMRACSETECKKMRAFVINYIIMTDLSF